jgi:hypothetical protein
VERGQQGHHADGDGGAQRPACHGQPASPLPEQVRIELVAGQQEQEAQPDVGQQLDAAGVGQAQPVRADQDAQEDQDDPLRHPLARQRRRDDRRDRGHDRHRQQRFQALVDHACPLRTRPAWSV